MLGYGDCEGFHDVLASNSAVGGAYAYGSDSVITVWVFVEGHEVVGGIELGDLWMNFVVEDELEEGCIEVKIRALI